MKKKNSGAKVRLWDEGAKMYCSMLGGYMPCRKPKVEFSTGLFDRNGKEIFWNDQVAVFMAHADNFLGVYAVNERFFFQYLAVGDSFSLTLSSGYEFEVVGTVHHKVDETLVKNFIRKAEKYE